VYPDLMRPAANAVPFWLTWLVAFPRYRRRRRGPRDLLYLYKRLLFAVLTSSLGVLLAASFPLCLYLSWELFDRLRVPRPAELVELDDRLGPLLEAVRVALGRHHQVVVVCPWPPGLELPGKAPGGQTPPAAPAARPAGLVDLLGRVTTARLHAAYDRLRRTFA